MADRSESSPLVPPTPIAEPSEIDLEAGPGEQIQCRICLETDGRDFIAPCKCKGTSKYVHRECLDHWRAVREGFAFAHCTTCKAPYHLRVHVAADRKWRTLKFRFFVTRDIIFIFLAVQLVIASLAYLVYLIDGYQQFWLRLAWGFDSELSFYYICGALLFFALLGLSGCFITCYDRRVRNDLAQPCRELCLCCCQPGVCADCHLPGTLCMWTDCTTCFESCAGMASECGCLGGAGEAGLPLLFIMALIVLGLFTVIGIFYSVLVATMVGQRIWQRHYHILAKRMLTKKNVDWELKSCPSNQQTPFGGSVSLKMGVPASAETFRIGLDESYRPLPSLYLAFLSIWFVSACSWTMNTYKNRHSQTNNLQWLLASVPLIKALQLTLSFLFWYSCFNLQVCSLWMSFGVYVTAVLFQTACFVSFLLISHGYCIMCERLSVTERRTTAALGCVFYLTLVGYRASVPYFTVLLLLNYLVSFYVIFHHISQNLSVLREQLSFIEDEDVQTMHDAVYTKYTMFKKFQGVMQIVAIAETVIHMNLDDSSETYWLRLLVREWAQFCIFMYIGWTFRSQDMTPRFSVMPTLKSKGENVVPPIYSIEMDAATFRDFSRHQWHIGVPTSSCEGSKDAILVIIQPPHAYRLTTPDVSSPSSSSIATSLTDSNTSSFPCNI